MPHHMPLTHEERLIVIHRSYPIRIAYTGKIWGGVQIGAKFMRDEEEDLLLAYPEGGYDGLYAHASNLASADPPDWVDLDPIQYEEIRR